MGCSANDQKWRLTCNGTAWLGTYDTCPHGKTSGDKSWTHETERRIGELFTTPKGGQSLWEMLRLILGLGLLQIKKE